MSITKILVEQPATVAVALVPGRGRGILARRHFKPGDLIETCPVIVVEQKDVANSLLDFYTYRWKDDAAVVLGYGMLYNHSFAPNAKYVRRTHDHLIDFIALEPINANNEILINYNGDPEDLTPIQFHEEGWWREGEPGFVGEQSPS